MIAGFIQPFIYYDGTLALDCDCHHPENRWLSLVANWFDVTLAGV